MSTGLSSCINQPTARACRAPRCWADMRTSFAAALRSRSPIAALLAVALLILSSLTPASADPILHTGTSDPCLSVDNKASAKISVSSATTTGLVATSGSTVIYVCHFDMSIAGSATSAATAQLEFGTGAACVTTQSAITGTYGSNDAAVSTVPTVVSGGDGGFSVAISSAGAALCVVTAGTSPFVQGVVTYVQQ
jgi:hypothetical protein